MNHVRVRFAVFAIFVITLVLPVIGHGQAGPSSTYERGLFHLCRVWGLAKYYHPTVAAGHANWDLTLLNTVPKLQQAANDDEIRAVLLEMLNVLGDAPDPGGAPEQFTAEERQLYDVSWIDDPWYSGTLGEYLRHLRDRARIRDHVQVFAEPGTGKPVFDADTRFNDEAEFYPPEDARVLAFCRFWNAIEYFYPYRDILDKDWHDVLAERIGEWAAAPDTLAYHCAALRTAVELCDAHVSVNTSIIAGFLGAGYAPFTAMTIDGRTVINRSMHPEIQPGEFLVSLDDVPFEQRMEYIRPYCNKPNPNSLDLSIMTRALRGPLGYATANIEDAQGNVRTVTFERTAENAVVWNIPRRSAVIDTVLMSGARYGYVDMARLERSQTYDVMEALRETDAIIFDLRGYPKGTIVDLVKLLMPAPQPIARFSSANPYFAGMLNWMTTVFGGGGPWTYEGKIIVLIDEVAISHAEYTAMFFKAIPRAVFIGSQTRGSDGNVTRIYLPGGLDILFTGLGVFYPDGSPTQRVGIQPDIPVRPSIAGLRAGRDEVFDAAFDPLLLADDAVAVPGVTGMALYPSHGRGDVQCALHGLARGDYRLDVYDALGRLLHSDRLSLAGDAQLRIPATAFGKGMFFVRLHSMDAPSTPALHGRFLRW
ncbi:MAG TPA: S41 family peptidase [Bacteroidota bacterium]|nr:S41 family peptidase [Bacteroidota bacterium]